MCQKDPNEWFRVHGFVKGELKAGGKYVSWQEGNIWAMLAKLAKKQLSTDKPAQEISFFMADYILENYKAWSTTLENSNGTKFKESEFLEALGKFVS